MTQQQLERVIIRLLAENPKLHYFQGLHDVVLTFLLEMGEDIAYAIMNVLVKCHIRCRNLIMGVKSLFFLSTIHYVSLLLVYLLSHSSERFFAHGILCYMFCETRILNAEISWIWI